MTAPRTRVGLVGVGGIGAAYVDALVPSASVELVGVADERPAALERAAATIGCATYPTHVEMLERGGVEAVIVATPPVTHERITSDCLARKVPVLCEKPFALDAMTARALAERAAESGVLLTMASKFRYVDDVLHARRVIDEGMLGELLLVDNAFTAFVDMRGRWNADPKVSGGGVLVDNGTHSVDLIRYLLGPIARVHALEGPRAQGLAVEDTVVLSLESATGVRAHVDLSWTVAKHRPSFLEVHGTKGALRVGWAGAQYRPEDASDWVTFGTGYRKLDALRLEVENFAAAVRGEEALRITVADAVASVDVVQAAYASMAQGGWESVAGHGMTSVDGAAVMSAGGVR